MGCQNQREGYPPLAQISQRVFFVCFAFPRASAYAGLRTADWWHASRNENSRYVFSCCDDGGAAALLWRFRRRHAIRREGPRPYAAAGSAYSTFARPSSSTPSLLAVRRPRSFWFLDYSRTTGECPLRPIHAFVFFLLPCSPSGCLYGFGVAIDWFDWLRSGFWRCTEFQWAVLDFSCRFSATVAGSGQNSDGVVSLFFSFFVVRTWSNRLPGFDGIFTNWIILQCDYSHLHFVALSWPNIT